MNIIYRACLMAGTVLTLSSYSVVAQESHDVITHNNNKPHHHRQTFPVPINIMGDHTHNEGDWMLSYRFKRMHMGGNLDGTNSISPEGIVTSVSNPNSPPSTLRVVPTQMDANMHMFSAMYGVTNQITLMIMAKYLEKEMDHTTFSGMSGTTRLGNFMTRSQGWGDTSFSGLVELYKTNNHILNASLGISIPTGSIKKEDDVLAPTGARPRLRLPYAMQLGSGTWDVIPTLTYTGHIGSWGWGAQYGGIIRLEGENSQNYRWGDKHSVTGWGGYKFSEIFSATMRITGEKSGKIKGDDILISAPVQTADPNNYGRSTIETGVGFVFTPQTPTLPGLEFGTEIIVPLYQNLNGPQLKRDWHITAGITLRY